MLNGNGRAEQDFWSLATDEWPNPLLDYMNFKNLQKSSVMASVWECQKFTKKCANCFSMGMSKIYEKTC